MRVLGLDPGFAITGFAVIEEMKPRPEPLTFGCIRTASHLPHHERLKIIYDDINTIIEKYQPEVAAIEKLFFNRNVTNALKVGEARGVVILALAQAQIPIFEYTPLQVKQALVGYGRADKKQIQYMVRAEFNLAEVPKPDDVADACAVGLTHIRSRILTKMMGEK